MANYNVIITDGNGSERMQRGTYAVTAEAAGYDVSTLSPQTFNATDSAAAENFTLIANGTLTINVNETGAQGGTPITSGTIIMTNETGTTDYGTAVNIGATGDAVFNNVPYGTTEAPIALYFRQLTTDENHNVNENILTVSMTEQTITAYLQNTATAVQTFTLTDGTYTGLPIDGTLIFTGN